MFDVQLRLLLSCSFMLMLRFLKSYVEIFVVHVDECKDQLFGLKGGSLARDWHGWQTSFVFAKQVSLNQ